MHFPQEVLHIYITGSSRLSAREVKSPAESFTTGARRAQEIELARHRLL